MISSFPPFRARGALLLGGCWLLALLVGAPSCADDASSAEPAPPEPVTDQQFVAQYAQILCEKKAACGCLGTGSSEVECRQNVQQNLSFEILPNPGAPFVDASFDGACAARFLAEMREKLSCNVGVSSLYGTFSCSRCALFAGKKTSGESCNQFSRWKTSCEQGLSCAAGQCRPLSCVPGDNGLPGVGAPCPQGVCQAGLLCVFPQGEGGTPTCRSKPGLGQPCQGVCEVGLFCGAPAGASGERTCQAPREDGFGCNAYEQCRSGFCPDGACRTPPAVGAPCYQDTLCGPGHTCQDKVCKPGNGAVCFEN